MPARKPRTKVVSLRLAEDQAEYLVRMSRRLGRTPSATAAMLVDEGLRRERFPQIEMRDTAAGRTAYIRGTRLPVWMMVSRMWDGQTPEEVAASLETPVEGLRAALEYSEFFREEIQTAIDDDRLAGENLHLLPGYTPYPR